jgi:SNF2 family DNA or RNA helicase
MTTLKKRLPGFPENWQPDELQMASLTYLVEHAAAGLLVDPGGGKTSVSLAAFSYLKKMGVANRALVIAPIRVAQLVWPAEAKKWAQFSHLKIAFVHGAKKDLLLEQAKDADVVVTNFESIPWLFNITTYKHSRGYNVTIDRKRTKALGFDTLIIDELSKFKNHKSIRSKTIQEMGGIFARRWGLTGSIAANSLMNLFGECLALDEGRTFGPHITKFRATYFDVDPYNPFSFILKDGAEDKLHKAIKPLCFRVENDTYTSTIPKLVQRVIDVELSPVQFKAYTQLKKDLVTLVDDRKITAANAGVASMKCRQFISGAVYKELQIEDLKLKHKGLFVKEKGPRPWVRVHDAKLDALEELVEELEGQPILVAYDFKHSLDRLIERFKDVPHAVFSGGMSKKETAETERKWLAGEIQILFAQAVSAAHGLNLQHWGTKFPRHVCWFDPIWDFEVYDQFNRRIRRRGNKAKVVYVHHIVASKTLDEKVLSTLHQKNRVQNNLYAALLEMAKEN